MRLYKIAMDGDFGDADSRAYWTGRKSEIAKLRDRLKAEVLDDGRTATVEVVDFQNTKDGLLTMLNRCAGR